jgi:hypothetical protein
MTDINARPAAVKAFRDALAQFRHAQRDVADRGDDEIQKTLASLDAKAERWRMRLEQYQSDLARCEWQAAAADAEGRYVDCSGFARAVAEAEERLDNVRQWQRRVEQEADAFRGTASRFRDLLDVDTPRAEAHLLAVIDGLEAVRDVRLPGT